MKKIPSLFIFLLLALIPHTDLLSQELSSQELSSQELFTLRQCLDYALENNQSLQKDRLGLETSVQAKRELIGSLLPQISATAGLTNNIQKTTVAMPNFIENAKPEAQRDPTAPKYLTVTMGMDYSANWGASLSQQLVNFSLFNALTIANTTAQMTELGVEMSENDVIAQTALVYYNVQVLEYAVSQFDKSIDLMDKTLNILQVNKDNGLVRQVDLDRLTVTRTNLETEKSSISQAMEIQKNLLKLQMGYPMTDPIEVEALDIDRMEGQLRSAVNPEFHLDNLLPYRILKQQKTLAGLQYKSAVYENLPTLSFGANYSMNYIGDDFKGETFRHFPVSMLSLNLRMPIFSGLSKTAKAKKAKIEMMKTEKDAQMLEQSLRMSHNNAIMQLEQQLRTIDSQHRNKNLAEEVYNVTQYNFEEGISPFSDVINASSSMIEAQMNYVDALSKCMKAYIDLKKADGTVADIRR